MVEDSESQFKKICLDTNYKSIEEPKKLLFKTNNTMNKEDRKIYKECKKILRKHGCLRLHKRIVREEARMSMYDWAKYLLNATKNTSGLKFIILVPIFKNTQYKSKIYMVRDEFEEFLNKNNLS